MQFFHLRGLFIAVSAAAALTFVAAPTARAGNGKEALSLFSPNTNAVINFNVKRLQNSRGYDEILKLAETNPKTKDALKELNVTGVDLRQDIDTVTIGMVLGNSGSDPDNIVVVADGRFDQRKVIAHLKAKNKDMKQRKVGRSIVYELGADGAMVFLGKRLILADKAVMNDVIARAKRKRGGAARSRVIKKLMGRVDTTRDFWAVVQIQNGAKMGMPMAGKIRSIVGSVDLQVGLGIRLRTRFSDAQVAKELVSQFEGVKGMVANAPEAKKMGLDVLINKSVLIADEKDVVFSVDLTASDAKKLKGMADMMDGVM